MRRLFNFAPSYRPLNHGSYGTFPRCVLEHRQQLQRDFEARECIYKQFIYPKLLRESRALVAPLLGADKDEVVFVPNATTGINTVLRNFVYEEGDVIVYPSSIYAACLKTIQSLQETTPVRGHRISVTYPMEDDEILERFQAAVEAVLKDDGTGRKKRIRLAIFDTIVSGPGVRVPWERLVKACRERGILSMIDGAHAIGHIDMTHTASGVKPDFLVTNCHKWLYVPRGCAVLYVPFANQHLVKTGLPTSHGYWSPEIRDSKPTTEYFTNLFADISTNDYSSFTTVPAALKFRNEVCGGEEAIREYCTALAFEGGNRAAEILGTEVMDTSNGSIRRCVFANVRLPLSIQDSTAGEIGGGGDGDIAQEDVAKALLWIYTTAAVEYDTYMQTFYYAGNIWTRFSAQIYLEMADIEWGARTLLTLCDRVKDGEWRSLRSDALPSEMRDVLMGYP
ncbi:aminotransferase family protein-like protein [Bombardia bombarda]|uniref:Aminotransferase family protein-like protein n=1 Tax=Bombardia bombarda TaxID=252184 RepID=A0AA39U0D0_9PEZI|nr:aminotransferase family protein-like protein [Bombardia bombarda]